MVAGAQAPQNMRQMETKWQEFVCCGQTKNGVVAKIHDGKCETNGFFRTCVMCIPSKKQKNILVGNKTLTRLRANTNFVSSNLRLWVLCTYCNLNLRANRINEREPQTSMISEHYLKDGLCFFLVITHVLPQTHLYVDIIPHWHFERAWKRREWVSENGCGLR